MMYGSYFNLCTPQIQRDEEEDGLEFLLLDVFLRQLYWFGPLPDKIVEVANEEVVDVIATLKEHNMPAQQGMFKTIPESELSKKDNEFIRRIMKLDWRDRPSAKELLEDQWWNDE
jgi:NH3-dependent NAD+ synthetase